MQENIQHSSCLVVLLAGRNSPAPAQQLAALPFLFPRLWSELLRSALSLLGRGGRLERRGASSPQAAALPLPVLAHGASETTLASAMCSRPWQEFFIVPVIPGWLWCYPGAVSSLVLSPQNSLPVGMCGTHCPGKCHPGNQNISISAGSALGLPHRDMDCEHCSEPFHVLLD